MEGTLGGERSSAAIEDPTSGVRMPAQSIVYILGVDAGLCHAVHRVMASVGLHASTCPSAEAFFQDFDNSRPSCVVLDVSPSGENALSALDRIRAKCPLSPVILLTPHADVATAVQAMKRGAFDCVTKPQNDQLLLDAVHHALVKAQEFRRKSSEQVDVALRAARLTPREREVMWQVVQGKANKRIAADLGCSSKTVEVHRARVMEKMSANSVAELVRLAMMLDGRLEWRHES